MGRDLDLISKAPFDHCYTGPYLLLLLVPLTWSTYGPALRYIYMLHKPPSTSLILAIRMSLPVSFCAIFAASLWAHSRTCLSQPLPGYKPRFQHFNFKHQRSNALVFSKVSHGCAECSVRQPLSPGPVVLVRSGCVPVGESRPSSPRLEMCLLSQYV